MYFFIPPWLFSVTSSCDFQVSFQQRSEKNPFVVKDLVRRCGVEGMAGHGSWVHERILKSSTEVTQVKTPPVSRSELSLATRSPTHTWTTKSSTLPVAGGVVVLVLVLGNEGWEAFVYVAMSVCLSHVLQPLKSMTLSPSVCCWSTPWWRRVGVGEGCWWGHNSRLQGTINLNTSYLCLPLEDKWGVPCKQD